MYIRIVLIVGTLPPSKGMFKQ